MSFEIGNIHLPIVSEISIDTDAETTEIKDAFKYHKTQLVKHEPGQSEITITGFVCHIPEVHPDNISSEEQKSRLRSLEKSNVENNFVDYKEFYGHFLVESVNFDRNTGVRILDEVQIDALYFPYPKYYRGEL